MHQNISKLGLKETKKERERTQTLKEILSIFQTDLFISDKVGSRAPMLLL